MYVQVDDLKCSIKFQLKKVLCMGVAVAHVGMPEREIYINTQVQYTQSVFRCDMPQPATCAAFTPVVPFLS